MIRTVFLSIWTLLVIAASASATPIFELEANGTATNNTRFTAEAIPGSAFTLPVPPTVFDPPGYATATIFGRGGASDVDFYSFMAGGGNVYFDIDNSPFTFDTVVSLFDGGGTLLAYDDDSGPADPGSANALDSFLGVYTLPGPGTYYLGVSYYPNFPTASGSGVPTALVRPDGFFGGFAVAGATPGVSSFSASGTQAGLGYTLHASLEQPTEVPVPEPMTLVMVGTGLAVMSRIRRRKS